MHEIKTPHLKISSFFVVVKRTQTDSSQSSDGIVMLHKESSWKGGTHYLPQTAQSTFVSECNYLSRQ